MTAPQPRERIKNSEKQTVVRISSEALCVLSSDIAELKKLPLTSVRVRTSWGVVTKKMAGPVKYRGAAYVIDTVTGTFYCADTGRSSDRALYIVPGDLALLRRGESTAKVTTEHPHAEPVKEKV